MNGKGKESVGRKRLELHQLSGSFRKVTVEALRQSCPFAESHVHRTGWH